MRDLEIAISGMSCGHCVGRVTKALSAVPGVRVDDVQIGSARVAYEPSTASPDVILRAVRDLGYGAEAPEAA